MAIIGIITNIGLNVAQKAANNEGWKLVPTKFSVSDIAGDLDATRTTPNTEWYSGTISPPVVRSDTYIEYPCHIPPQITADNKIVNEIYLWVLDPETSEEVLFGIAQPENPIEYYPDGELVFRMGIIIQNTDLTSLFEFKYTQAYEISEHNVDENAHPPLQEAMKKAGIFVFTTDHEYVGQFWDEKATFDASVTTGMLVYRGTDGKYYPAIVDGTEKQKVVGYADIEKGRVIVSGLIETSLTYSAGTELYLSADTAGAFTDIPTPVKVGLSLGSGLILLGTVGGGGVSVDVNSEDILYYTLLYSSSFAECFYDTFSKPNTVTIPTAASITYDAANTALDGSATDYFEATILSGSTTTYYKFSVHVEADDAVSPILEYSTDDGASWISANLDEIVVVDAGFTDLMIRITWNGAGKIYSFGVLYKEEGYNYITDIQAFETMEVTSSQTAPVTITLPNNMVYVNDGKSLEVYLNRVRLVNGVDFEEVDSRTIKLNIDLNAGDTLLFIQKYGYVDTSVENKSRLDYEHNDIGQHIFTDLTTGKKYRLAVDNGQLVLIEQ